MYRNNENKTNLGYNRSLEIKTIVNNLRNKKKEMKKASELIYELQDNGFIKKGMGKPIRGAKKVIYGLASHLPGVKDKIDPMMRGDPLDVMEESFRGYPNDIDENIRNLSVIVQETEEEYEELKVDVKKAEKEKWDANRLREYIMNESNIAISEEVKNFFIYTTNQSTPEKLEERRTSMLEMLKNQLLVLEKQQGLMGKVAEVGREVYDRALIQYSGFMAVKDPLAVMKEAALGYAETDDLGLNSKEYIQNFVEKTADTLGVVVEALSVIDENLIASKETAEVIKNAKEKLESKLKGETVKVKTKRSQIKVSQ